VDVSETDIEIFYLLHRDRFRGQEVRSLRHILVTIGASRQDRQRVLARRKIDNLRARLLKAPQRFAELAARHSECASAGNGGWLGDIRRGQLHPPLEKAAFSLRAGELSRVIESPRGFHLVHCLSISPEDELPLSTVREKIRAGLAESRRRATRAEWAAGRFAPAL
jgi:parvulin-like peptidyl-prolyl isomerase